VSVRFKTSESDVLLSKIASVSANVDEVAVKVSLPAVPTTLSTPVVSDLINGFDTLLILNTFLSILLDINYIAYIAPISATQMR
jgi:hypothetical protein